MQQMADQLQSYSSNAMSGSNPALAKMKLGATNQVNKNYQNMPRTVTSQLSGRGFGKSGKLGKALYDVQGSRMNDLTGLEGSFADMGRQQTNFGATMGQQLLNSLKGNESTGAGSAAGNGLMSAGNGLENIAQMLMMSKILGGGSSGPADDPWS